MDKMHCCNGLKLDQKGDEDNSISIQYDDKADGWLFIYRRYADDKEVEMGEAEYKGELVFGLETKISFCPYCGI